ESDGDDERPLSLRMANLYDIWERKRNKRACKHFWQRIEAVIV
ncbi:hypothetical protein ALC56_07579, partial [Trachymyrmex septentrionalis]